MNVLKNAAQIFLICIVCAQPNRLQAQTQLKLNKIADIIMERMDLKPGEKVVLVGNPGRFDPLFAALKQEISKSGAIYLGAFSSTDHQPENWTTEFVKKGVLLTDTQLKEYLEAIDIGIMLPGANPENKFYRFIQENLNDGHGRTIHFHWYGAYDMNGEEIQLSTEIDRFYENALLTTDYAKLSSDQLRFENALRGKTINVSTNTGTDISFEIGNRPVTKQDGDASAQRASRAKNLIDREVELPSGAIRVAPIETTVNGKIAFPDAHWNQTLVKDLVLTFAKGKVVDMRASAGIESVQKVMETQGDAAKSFREFALGLNPKLAIPKKNPWIPYYGYGSGIVRLSLGDNTELGGMVSGGYIRWNFFTDATVTVGDEIWVKNGKLIK